MQGQVKRENKEKAGHLKLRGEKYQVEFENESL